MVQEQNKTRGHVHLWIMGKIIIGGLFGIIGVMAALQWVEFSGIIIVFARSVFILSAWMLIDEFFLKGIDTRTALKENNIAYAIVCGAFILAMALCFTGV